MSRFANEIFEVRRRVVEFNMENRTRDEQITLLRQLILPLMQKITDNHKGSMIRQAVIEKV